jgi:serine protease inhibitor
MKSTLFLILLVVSSLYFAGCKKDNTPNLSTNDVKSKLKSAQIVNASNKYCFELFKSIQNKAPDKNLFISPFSTMEALSMAYNGAAGTTKDEMAGVLGFSQYSDKEINEYNQSLTSALIQADEKVKFEVANSIWYKQGFPVLQSFLDVNSEYYDAEVKALDFSSPDAVTTINNWVDAKTHDKIQTIIDAIPPEAVMYLINAIYFKGSWQYEFDKTKTTTTDFYLTDGSTVQQNQMSMETSLNYYSSADFEVVELPYGSGAFNFMIVLPLPGKNINDITTGLTDTKWADIINSMNKVKIVVKMPKIKFELNSLLNDPLINLGMKSAFNADIADFSRIDSARDLFISRVIHKTYIDLDEEGTEAAAVTAVEFEATAILNGPEDKPIFFVANRPFIYAITEKSTGAVLFIGKMLDPTVSKVDIQ